MKAVKIFFLSALGLICCFWLKAQPVPAPPSPPRLVNDLARLLSPAQSNELERKLVSFNDSTGTQITLVTVNSLEGYPIEQYAVQLALKWGIGQQEKNNGLLVLVAAQERQVRIEVGYGLEAVIPDATAKRVIEEIIIPQFKAGNYYTGLDQGTQALMQLALGEFPASQPPPAGDEVPLWLLLLIIFVMISLLTGVFGLLFRGHRGRTYGSDRGAFWRSLLMGMLLGRMGRGGGGGGFGSGKSGGGFGGFGGGSFGGGGASGRW